MTIVINLHVLSLVFRLLTYGTIPRSPPRSPRGEGQIPHSPPRHGECPPRPPLEQMSVLVNPIQTFGKFTIHFGKCHYGYFPSFFILTQIFMVTDVKNCMNLCVIFRWKFFQSFIIKTRLH